MVVVEAGRAVGMAGQAPRRRRRLSRAARAARAWRPRRNLLPAKSTRKPGGSAFSCRRRACKPARLQCAVVFSHASPALPLWRRGTAGGACALHGAIVVGCSRPAHRCPVAGRAQQRGFPGRRRTLLALGDQSTTGRDARYFRTARGIVVCDAHGGLRRHLARNAALSRGSKSIRDCLRRKRYPFRARTGLAGLDCRPAGSTQYD